LLQDTRCSSRQSAAGWPVRWALHRRSPWRRARARAWAGGGGGAVSGTARAALGGARRTLRLLRTAPGIVAWGGTAPDRGRASYPSPPAAVHARGYESPRPRSRRIGP
jgi:hypothetical protein